METPKISWPHILEAYEKLVQAEERFLATDLNTPPSTILKMLKDLEEIEHNVWIAWAECTSGINPNLADDLKRQYPVKVTGVVRDLLNKKAKNEN